MKYKFILAFLLSAFCLSVFATDDKYIEALRNCSLFTDSGSVNVDGINTVSTKQIQGWSNGKCKYKETVNIGGMNANILCNFSKSQIQEITSVADAYFLTLKYSNKDAYSQEAMQNSPLTNVFNKYLQNPDVCTIDLK